MNNSNEAHGVDTRTDSATEKLISIYTKPHSVFLKLKDKPEWLLPFIIIIIVSLGFSLATMDAQLVAQREAITNNKLIPEESRDAALADIEDKTLERLALETLFWGTLGISFMFVFVSGVFWILGNFILSGSASYKHVFSVYTWSSLITIPELIVKLPMILEKGSFDVFTSLAVFLDASHSDSALFKMLDAADLFLVWKLFVFAIGFSIIYNFSRKKSYISIISVYLLYVLVSIGLTQLFLGFTN